MIRCLFLLPFNRIYYGFGVLKKVDSKRIPIERHSFNAEEVSKFHEKLRTHTKASEFINTLKNSRKELQESGPLIAMEVLSENFNHWNIDQSMVEAFEIMDQYKLNIIETIEKLKLLGFFKARLRKTPTKSRSPKLYNYIDEQTKIITNNLKNLCMAGKLTFVELQNYFKTFVDLYKYPESALKEMEKYLSEDQTIVARNWNYFMKGYSEYPFYLRQKYPKIERFICQKLEKQLSAFSLFNLSLLFRNLAALKWQVNSSNMKIPQILDQVADKIKEQIAYLSNDSVEFIFEAYKYLPLSYSNQLLQMCVKHTVDLTENSTPIRIIRAISNMPSWRINKSLLKPLLKKVDESFQKRLLTQEFFNHVVLNEPKLLQLLSESKEEMLNYIINELLLPEKIFEKYRVLYLQAIVLLSKNKKPVLSYLNRLNRYISQGGDMATVRVPHLTKLLMASVIEKERTGTTELDAAINKYIDFILPLLENFSVQTLIRIVTLSFQTKNEMLSNYHEHLYKHMIKHWNRMFGDAWHLTSLNIIEILRSTSVPVFYQKIMEFLKDKNAESIKYFLYIYTNEEEKSKQIAEFIFAIMLAHRQNLKDSMILRVISHTPLICLTDSHGTVHKELQLLINSIKGSEVEPALLTHVTKMLSSTSADCKNLKEQLTQSNFDKADIITIESMIDSLKNEGNKETTLELMNKLLKMSTGKVNARILTNILTLYHNVTKSTGKVDPEIVKNLLSRILSQHLSAEYTQTRIGLLLLNAVNFIQLQEHQKASLIDGVKTGSKWQLINLAMKNQPEWVNYRQMTKEYEVIKNLVIPLVQESLTTMSVDLSLIKAILLLQLGQQYHSHKIIDIAAEIISKVKIMSVDATRIVNIMNVGKITSTKIHNRLVQLIQKHGRTLYADTKIHTLYMLAKSYYSLPSQYKNCVYNIQDSINYFLSSSGKVDALLNRTYLNYLWSILTLNLSLSNKSFQCCLDMFTKRAIGMVKTTANPFLLGLISDIFHLLYKKNILNYEFVEEMLRNKNSWMRNTCKKFDHSELREGVWKEAYEKDGLVVDYFDGKKVIVSLHSFYLHEDGTETGYSKARDMVIEQVLGKVQIIKKRTNLKQAKEINYLDQ